MALATQCYAKLAYKATKAIFHANNVQYDKHTIVQLTHLECDLEKLKLKVDGKEICNLDIKDMYPCVRYRLIRKAINHYSLTFTEEELEVIKAALEMLKFSMGNTLVTFATNTTSMEWKRIRK